MYENRTEPLLSRRAFFLRLGRHAAASGGLILGSLALGATGYRLTTGMPWLDAVLNATMILTGMGPMKTDLPDTAKLFATFYALHSGIAFLTMMAVLLAPLIHRLLHTFHVEESDDGKG